MNMDLERLENASDVYPLLVELYDNQKLDTLVRCPDEESRTELTSIMAGLLNAKLNLTEQELITDVLIGLMRQAETDLRKALADRVSTMDDVPLRMILHLANDEPMVADHILRKSPVLQDMDLVYIIKSQGPEHWQSVARRQFINGQVVDVLADTKDLQTAITLTENETATLTQHAIGIFADLAEHSQALAKPLLLRQELPKGVARKIYQVMGDVLEKSMRNEYGYHVDKLSDDIADLALEFEEADNAHFMPSDRQIQNAHNMKAQKELTLESMMRVLRRGQIASFIAQFSAFSKMSPKTVHDILEQERGQGLAIACKALHISKPDFMSLFLLTGKMRGRKDSVVDQYELAAALDYFSRVSVSQAEKILKASQNI